MNRVCLNHFLVIMCLFLLLVSCRKNNDTIVHISKDDYTFEDQKEIGKSLKELILGNSDRFPVLNKTEYPEFYNYLNTLMDMLSNTDMVQNRTLFDWDVTIIQDDTTRTAFMTPGGHLFIYTGLLKFIRSESELVSIIAHEINYAETTYLIDRLKSEFGKDIIGDLLLGNNIPETRDVAYNIRDLIFAINEVSNADRYTIQLICPFQYNALGLKSFLENAERSNLEIEWLLTRPGASNRISKIEDMAQDCGEEEESFSERYENFKSLLP